ncbi:helix-turn-helix transcriptional regulator [Mycolicibacterium neworleansense]|uniref:Helix-turn-helix domain protein n=1 Tax=Mycolicibacterium neworleansense TaxID=146018 RepID=A0A0H5RVZ3_9MYCO|nr:helix-turn-helix domain-containing protein [Mycolicibacterium neworleansense]MCV7365484.1 helix-turn-helix domain-containing protein [Mycolicibacterium neworleansense]CRZ17976.1 Helix-turn-helix domain protein [Mycolicibacterium neworleansense]
MEKPLTTEEVSALLGIPAATLRYWRHLSPPEGPRCYRLGRKRIVYDPADVQSWRESRKAETARGGQ